MYCKQNRITSDTKQLKNHANSLAKEDFERKWIFVYEVLSENELLGDWEKLKKAGLSFIDITSKC